TTAECRDRVRGAGHRIVDVGTATTGLELFTEGRLTHVARFGGAETQAIHQLELAADLPAFDLAGQRVVGLTEGEVGIEALCTRARFPHGYVQLCKPFPHVEFTGCPARGGEVVH